MRQEPTHWCTAVYCLSTGNLVTVYPGCWGIYMIAGMNTGVCWYWTICDMFFFVEMYFVRHGGKPLQYVADPLRMFDQVVWPDGCIVSFMSPLARSPRLVPALVKCLFSMTLVVLFIASYKRWFVAQIVAKKICKQKTTQFLANFHNSQNNWRVFFVCFFQMFQIQAHHEMCPLEVHISQQVSLYQLVSGLQVK